MFFFEKKNQKTFAYLALRLRAAPRPATPRLIAGIYIVFALLGVLLLASTMPPFLNADETPHAYRADQISHFGLIGQTISTGESGGQLDIGMALAHKPFDEVLFGRQRRVDVAMYTPIAWGSVMALGFPSTAPYPPLFYLPAAFAIGATRLAGTSVLHGLLAARLAQGLASIAVGALAIALADGAALFVYALLLLPMTMAQDAALSQDGPMIACTALAACLCRRAAGGNRGSLPAAAVLLALAATARPAYAALALPLLGARAPWRHLLAYVSGVVGATAAWSLFTAHLVRVPQRVDGVVDPHAQLLGLVLAPWRLPPLIWHTLQRDFAVLVEQFVGVLGYLNVQLPRMYHRTAWVILLVALLSLLRASQLRTASSWLLGLASLGTALGVGLLLYMTWTNLGAPWVDGLQGRYFLPPALMMAALPQRQTPVRQAAAGGERRLLMLAEWAVLLFPILGIAVTMHAIIVHFYI